MSAVPAKSRSTVSVRGAPGRNEPSRHWGAVVPFMPAALVADQARALETAGLRGILAPQIYGPPFVALAAAAAATERVDLLSGIAIAGVRSPVETAAAAMDLDRLSGGRFILGLGTSVRSWSEGIFGMPSDRPVARLREAVELIRLVIAKAHTGELRGFAGEFHRHDFSAMQVIMPPPVRTEIPIWIAGNQQRTIRLAAEIADGVMGHPIWSVEWATGQGAAAVAHGLARAGRDRDDIHLQLGQFVAIDDDRRQAVEDGRATVAFYAAVEAYEPYFSAHGFREQAARCQEVARKDGYRSATRHVPDEMVERFVLCGPADRVRKRFRPLDDLADSFWLLPPLFGPPPERAAELAGRIAETFYI
jgi:probable F420-dependent oxidoreductase